jgi:Relaxase/Mobilisation nuclease domain
VISKALRGHDVAGLVRYLFGPGRANEHTNQRVVACSDPTWTGTVQPDAKTTRQLIAELHDPVVRHGDCTKDGYVYHVAVSLSAEDGQLSDERWRQVAQRFADKLGFDDQVHWVAINHGLTTNGNDHIHLVTNLIRDDTGRAHKLSYDRMRRREACIELEEEFGLTATAPAGQGLAGSLSRREVEAVRAGAVASVSELNQHRVATIVRAVATGARSEPEFVERLRGEGLIVRARHARDDRGTVTGYSVAAKTGGGREPLVWYGGGRLSKDLRLPTLRTRWAQTDQQRKAAAAAWFSDAAARRKAEPRNLAGAADAMRQAANRLQKLPPEDRFSWYVAATEAAGVVAAAASTTTDNRLRRDLIVAWKAINRAVPTATSVGVDVAPGDAAQLRLVGAEQRTERPAAVWAATTTTRETTAEVSTLLAGASRVLLAASLSDAPHHAHVRALIVQAIELAAQISRTIAAQQDATAAQCRAAEATRQAAATAATPVRGGWQFARSGTEVLEAARQARAAGAEAEVDQLPPTKEPGIGPTEPER